MSKPGIKEALRHLVAAAEALNGKVHVDHEDDLPLIEAFRQAAVDARDALAVSAERKAKKDGQGAGETPAGSGKPDDAGVSTGERVPDSRGENQGPASS